MIPAVVLAAGQGTRLGAATASIAKPMLPVGGVPVLVRNLGMLAAAGVRDVAINLHHAPDSVRDAVGDGSALGLRVRYSPEETLLGTAGGARRAAELLPPSSDILVLYGDNLVLVDLGRLVRAHRESGAVATLAVHRRRDVSQSGVVEFDRAQRIHRFVEKPRPGETASHWVNAAVYVLSRALLAGLPAGALDFGRDVFPALIDKGADLRVYRMTGGEAAIPIDNPALYRRAVRRFTQLAEATL